jgi:hypothetical protein
MATRARRSWKLDSQGHYARQIGWKLARDGKPVQHKFRLGADLNEAKRREQKLRELWDSMERSSSDADPVWSAFALNVAKRVAKGEHEIILTRQEAESELEYASRIQQLQDQFSPVRFIPDDLEAYGHGRRQLSEQNRQPLYVPWVPPDALESTRVVSGVDWGTAMNDSRETVQQESCSPATPRDALHQAMQDFIAWIEEEYYRPQLGRVTDYGRNKIRQVKTLMSRHDDIPLSQVDYEQVERMLRYWRQRPRRKGSDKQISVKSATNYIGELRRFFTWLHRSSRYTWKKPAEVDGIDATVARDHAREQERLIQAPVFTLDELVLLNRYATPLERVFLLLGLNCGFGMAEIATLTIGEVHLLEAHEARHQEILNFRSTNKDSFIKRIRRKNGVYGEFILFPQTVEAIRWVLGRRFKQPNPKPDAPLLLNDRGVPYDRPTKSGNRNQQIPNRFANLIRRVEDDGNEIAKLSFGKLRKTAGDLIRRLSDGEISGVFLCHGQPVKSDNLADIYTNRPFGKVFEAIRKAEEYLQPMFMAASPEPFESSSREYTSRKTADRIRRLHESGESVGKIAQRVGKSTTTVQRYVQEAADAESKNED